MVNVAAIQAHVPLQGPWFRAFQGGHQAERDGRRDPGSPLGPGILADASTVEEAQRGPSGWKLPHVVWVVDRGFAGEP